MIRHFNIYRYYPHITYDFCSQITSCVLTSQPLDSVNMCVMTSCLQPIGKLKRHWQHVQLLLQTGAPLMSGMSKASCCAAPADNDVCITSIYFFPMTDRYVCLQPLEAHIATTLPVQPARAAAQPCLLQALASDDSSLRRLPCLTAGVGLGRQQPEAGPLLVELLPAGQLGGSHPLRAGLVPTGKLDVWQRQPLLCHPPALEGLKRVGLHGICHGQAS